MAKKDYKRHPKRDMAGMMFIQWKMDGDEISRDLEVSEPTISKWRKEDNWDAQRRVDNLKSQNLINNYYEQSQIIIDAAKTAKRPLDSKECDMLAKLASSIEKLSKNVSPSQIMDVFMDFNNELKAVDFELVKRLIPHQRSYVLRKLNPQ